MRRQVLRLLAIALAVHAGVSAAAAPLCHRSSAAAPALLRLREALAHGRFVAYQPTALKVVDGRFSNADPASIRADLEVLRGHFDSLVTYDAVHGAQDIAPIAAALKFRALIIGVWEPADATQVGAALDAARRFPQLVVGVSLGNEALFSPSAPTPHSFWPRSPGCAPGAAAATDHQRAVSPLRGTSGRCAPRPARLPAGQCASGSSSPGSDERHGGDRRAVRGQRQRLARGYCGPMLVGERRPGSRRRRPGGYSSARQASLYKELRQRLPPGPMRAFTYLAPSMPPGGSRTRPVSRARTRKSPTGDCSTPSGAVSRPPSRCRHCRHRAKAKTP